MRGIDYFIVIGLNKYLNKHWNDSWTEIPWRAFGVNVMISDTLCYGGPATQKRRTWHHVTFMKNATFISTTYAKNTCRYDGNF